MVRAAVYVRISSDPSGLKAGVGRQEQDCRAYCERRGWDVAEVFADNDTSAYRGKARPAYRRMMEAVEARAVDAVVVYHLDRLTRHPRELEDFVEACDRAGVRQLGTVHGDVDLATDDGRLMARIMGAVARKESDDKSRRIARKARELAEQGKVGGGGTRPFGYAADRRTLDPTEAAVVRELARRALAGASLRSLAADLNARGVPTVKGGPWTQHVIRRLLTSARIAGWREHRGELVAEATDWPAIITLEQHQLLRARLRDPARLKRKMPPRRYLLTGGLARCGLCGEKLMALPRGDGRRAYSCRRGPGFTGCGRIRALADSLEEWVTAAVLVALASERLDELRRAAPEDADGPDQAVATELAAVEQRIDDLTAAHFVEGVVSRAEFTRLRAQLDERADGLRRRLAVATGTRALTELPPGQDVERWWSTASLEQRRAVLAAVVERVEVGPAIRGNNRFQPDRVQVCWRV